MPHCGLQTPDRHEPLSVGWAFLEGDQWFGARHLTLGVDRNTLPQTPSVSAHIEAFITRVAAIEGASTVPTKLDAYTFAPDIAPVAKEALVEALDALVEEVQGPSE